MAVEMTVQEAQEMLLTVTHLLRWAVDADRPWGVGAHQFTFLGSLWHAQAAKVLARLEGNPQQEGA